MFIYTIVASQERLIPYCNPPAKWVVTNKKRQQIVEKMSHQIQKHKVHTNVKNFCDKSFGQWVVTNFDLFLLRKCPSDSKTKDVKKLHTSVKNFSDRSVGSRFS
jgi:hypothetical protein